MQYITESFLNEKASESTFEKLAESQRSKLATLIFTKKIFLSHSHHDKILAKGLRNQFASLGIKLYVDWLDLTMPVITDRTTANKIKERINNCDHVLVLATKNALTSKWVPWEIGVADIQKTPSRISIIPVVDRSGAFHGNEYLQLYRKIAIKRDGSWTVLEPGKTNGMVFEEWLQSI